MTREEAATWIKEYVMWGEYNKGEYKEALGMAIKALEQEPCEDAISRELVKAEYKRRFKANLIDGSRGIDWSEYVNCEPFNEFIDSIPPVNSQPNTDVLDKIRAEIEQIADEEQKHDEKWAIGLRYAVKIIDKYRAEVKPQESEE